MKISTRIKLRDMQECQNVAAARGSLPCDKPTMSSRVGPAHYGMVLQTEQDTCATP